MEEIPLSWLVVALATLLLSSGFFSIAETSMMALNRYRLKHLVREGRRSARLTQDLLAHTDRLLGVILLGNNLLNSASTVVATLICVRLFGEGEVTLAIATAAVTFFILVFSEITPKVIGARFPEAIALPSAFVLTPLLRIAYPIVWFVNLFVQALLKLLFIRPRADSESQLSMAELRTLVLEGGKFIPAKHQSIFLNLFELEDMTVDDTMTPRGQIEAIDLEDDIDDIRTAISTAHHTRLVVFDGSLDKVAGILHVRKFLNASRREPLDREGIREILRDPYYVPEGTPLLTQLTNFQDQMRHVGLVVDEYGELLGLVTLQDILEEIVGEFTNQKPLLGSLLRKEPDGSIIAEGTCPLRVLNRKAGFHFPLDGPKTVNGLVLEALEDIPEPGTALIIAGHPMEILQVQNRMVKVVRIRARKAGGDEARAALPSQASR
ncbi:MAG TPA: HlyC/CorC family transporter [Usitatibacteraceae bacterium]|nr:HlyC/CorC family transporter [Usitatibacteraceae bacterium]